MERLDFSPHYLAAKKNLQDLYKQLNNGEYINAASLIDETIVELRLMRTAVKTHVKDSHG